MRRLKNRGQSVLEYVLVWTAIIAAIVTIISGALRGKIKETLVGANGTGGLANTVKTSLQDFAKYLGSK